MDINPGKIIQQRLATSMGLEKYAIIQSKVNVIDISKDLEFQRIFNGFYMVRRNAEWREKYYHLFEQVKYSENTNFDYLIDELYYWTGNVEASFASKMLATINPDMPIWDRYVVQNLDIKLPVQNDPKRIQKTKDIYASIVNWYNSFLITDNAAACIKKFDEILPDYIWLSDVKKIDFYWLNHKFCGI